MKAIRDLLKRFHRSSRDDRKTVDRRERHDGGDAQSGPGHGAYTRLRIASATYLVYLGIQALRLVTDSGEAVPPAKGIPMMLIAIGASIAVVK